MRKYIPPIFKFPTGSICLFVSLLTGVILAGLAKGDAGDAYFKARESISRAVPHQADADDSRTLFDDEWRPDPETPGRFTNAYVAAGRPRIAIFLNRYLSADVPQWQSVHRLVVSTDQWGDERRANQAAPPDMREKVTISKQFKPVEVPQGASPDDNWMWAFEDIFYNQFLEADTHLVDRAVIMRLIAGESHGGDTRDLSRQQIEMDALNKHADIVIEILVRRLPDSPLKYDFKAQAKEIKTGFVLANVTSRKWSSTPNRITKRIVATDTGLVATEEVDYPSVDEISLRLVESLMQKLTRRWERS